MNLVPVALRGTAFAAVATLALGAPAAVAYAAAPAAQPRAGAPSVVTPRAAEPAGLRPVAATTAGALTPAGCAATGTNAVSCDLWAKKGNATIGGTPIPIWGFVTDQAATPTGPEPVLVVHQGDTVTLTVHNELGISSQSVSLALPTMTGLAPDTVGAPSGGSKTYQPFTASRPGTYLLEAGHTVDGGRQAAMGLVGALVVLGPTDANNNPTAYDASSAYQDEAVMVLTEIDPALNTGDPLAFNMLNYAPKYRLINGKAFPETDPVATGGGRKVLLRYVNAGLQAHPMTTLGVDQLVVGQDSRPTSYPEGAVTVPLAPGNTVDALVNVPTDSGRRFMVFESGGQLNNKSDTYGTPQSGVSPQQAFGGMMTYLDTNAAEPSTDNVGPVTTRVAVSPATASVLDTVTVTADFSDATTGGAPIDQAELVIDDLGVAAGTGIKFTSDQFGTSAVTGATVTIPQDVLEKLGKGKHTLWVRAHDTAGGTGNWGVVNSAILNLAVTGPETTGVTVTPNPTNGSADLTVSATGDDTAIGSGVTQAEAFVDSGTPVPLDINQTGANVVAESGTIPATALASLGDGQHKVRVHTKDAKGLWGPMAETDLVIDRTGPTLLSGVALPASTNGKVGSPSDPSFVRINASFLDAASADLGTVSSPIVAAEGFLDTPGADGTGIAFQSLDGTFNTATENTYGLIPLSELTRLGEGPHPILVHARDAAGNWGPLTAIPFAVDRTGPAVSGLVATPLAATAGRTSASTVGLTATATDTLSGITAAEWFEGTTDPGVGAGKPIQGVTAVGPTAAGLSVQITGVSNGTHTYSVRAKDAAGNWGPVVTTTVTVNAGNFLFGDNFDAGIVIGAANWTANTGGRVGQSPAFGNSPALTVTGSAPAYVSKTYSSAQSTLHAQFGFAAGTYDTKGGIVDLFQGRPSATGGPALTVQYQRTTAGLSQLRVGILTTVNKNPAWVYSAWSTIPTTAVVGKVDWTSGNSGSATLSVNGVAAGTITGNTSAYKINTIALGVVAATAGTTGTGAIDNFTSNK